MKKNILTITIIALVLGVFVFGIAGSAYAQTTPPETEETLPAPGVTRRGFGMCDGTCDADGDGVPDQLRLRDGSGTGNQFGNSFGPGDGTCDADGDGIPDQLRLRDGSGAGQQYGMGMMGNGQGVGQGFGAGGQTGMGNRNGGMGQGYGAGSGTGRGAGGAGQGMGPGEGLGDGLGTHDGSCLDD